MDKWIETVSDYFVLVAVVTKIFTLLIILVVNKVPAGINISS